MSRLTIYDLEGLARERYPDKARDYYWIEKYAKMQSRIKGWQKKYSAEDVLLLVDEESRTTRSPGKIQAIQDWRSTTLKEEERALAQTEAAAQG